MKFKSVYVDDDYVHETSRGWGSARFYYADEVDAEIENLNLEKVRTDLLTSARVEALAEVREALTTARRNRRLPGPGEYSLFTDEIVDILDLLIKGDVT